MARIAGGSTLALTSSCLAVSRTIDARTRSAVDPSAADSASIAGAPSLASTCATPIRCGQTDRAAVGIGRVAVGTRGANDRTLWDIGGGVGRTSSGAHPSVAASRAAAGRDAAGGVATRRLATGRAAACGSSV